MNKVHVRGRTAQAVYTDIGPGNEVIRRLVKRHDDGVLGDIIGKVDVECISETLNSNRSDVL